MKAKLDANCVLSVVDVEMHIMDKKSVVIEQDADLYTGVNPHFVSLFVREDSINRIIAFTFGDWQKLHTKLYTKVPANMLVSPGGRK